MRNEKDDNALRPLRFADFVGQDRVKDNLQIAVGAARARSEALDHVLLHGPPGVGKTAISQILAREMGAAITITAAPLLDKKAVVSTLLSLRAGDIFFVDEIHRLRPDVEEVLYPALEDFRLHLQKDDGGGFSHPLNPFCFVGATTRPGMISAPLRSRFGIIHRLDFYSPEDLKLIVTRSARLLGCLIDEQGAVEIAKRSRGTPRIANRLLRRCRDYAELRARGRITQTVACEACERLGIDEHGLEDVDRRLLRSIIQNYGGGPVGLNTLAQSISEDPDSVEETNEPYMMTLGLISRTGRGRLALPAAYKLMNAQLPRVAGMVN